jgi:hypothetical protein
MKNFGARYALLSDVNFILVFNETDYFYSTRKFDFFVFKKWKRGRGEFHFLKTPY